MRKMQGKLGDPMSVPLSRKIDPGKFRRPLIDGRGSISPACKNRNWRVMKPVVQLERTGCGIASVAALAGVSYREMQRVANRLGIAADDPRLWSETGYVRRLLKEHGLRSASAEVPFSSWESLPDLALLAIKWHRDRGRSYWHWAVFWRGPYGPAVLDSKQALRRHVRTDFGRIKPKWSFL